MITEQNMSRILLTGHKGYIGSVAAKILKEHQYDIVGLDTGYFAPCILVDDDIKIPEINKDLRDITANDLEGFDAVVHLAALSNDPIGNLNDGWTEEINYKGSVHLAKLAKQAGVKRFLFSSSCIMYGNASADVVDETSELDPKTEYARSKVKAENDIRKLASDNFSPVFLRNGTVYGVSPHMRFDTVLNNLVGNAIVTGEVVLHSDGKPWRPVVHVRDVCKTIINYLEAPVEKIHNEAFNNGADELNHQIIELAEIVVKLVPNCQLKILSSAGADQRTYKASFKKFATAFPDFKFEWTVQLGAEELYKRLTEISLDKDTFFGDKFTRLKWLNHLLDTKQLDKDLYWNKS